MRTTSFKRNGIVYIEKRTCIDLDTGEEIDASTEWLKKNYKILNKSKKTSYSYLTKTTEIIWLMKKIPTQLQLI